MSLRHSPRHFPEGNLVSVHIFSLVIERPAERSAFWVLLSSYGGPSVPQRVFLRNCTLRAMKAWHAYCTCPPAIEQGWQRESAAQERAFIIVRLNALAVQRAIRDRKHRHRNHRTRLRFIQLAKKQRDGQHEEPGTYDRSVG